MTGGLPAESRAVLSGTLMDPRSVVCELGGDGEDRGPAPGYTSMIVSCVQGERQPTNREEAVEILSDPTTKVAWPEARPREWLLNKLTTDFATQPHLFILDFFNRTASSESILVSEADITRLEAWRTPESVRSGRMWIVCAGDPARGLGRRNCYSALAAIGYYLDGPDKDKFRVLEIAARKVASLERVRFFTDFGLYWRPSHYIIEINAASDLPLLMEQEMVKRKIMIPLVEIEQTPAASKEERIEEEAGLELAGRVLYSTDLPREHRQVLFKYPSCTHVDQRDVLAICLRWMRQNLHLASAGRIVVNDPEQRHGADAVFPKDKGIFVFKNGKLCDTMRDVKTDEQRELEANQKSWEAWDQ